MQALEALRKLRTEKMAEVKEFRLRLDHLRTHKDTAARLRKDVDAGERQEAEHADTIQNIDAELAEITKVQCDCLRLLGMSISAAAAQGHSCESMQGEERMLISSSLSTARRTADAVFWT